MAVSEIGAVFDFLRKNGFSEAESALRDDIVEKGELGSLDLEKFFIPMAPLPPPVNLVLGNRQSGFPNGIDRSELSSDSSDDFVSLGSSSTDVSPSGLTNPYALWSQAPLKSEASSDRFSEFDTAHDYHDSDMLNDMYLYDDKDGGDLKYPYFGRPDFFSCPSEDKFVTSSEEERQCEKPSSINLNCLDQPCLLNHMSMDDSIPITDYYHWDENVRPDQGAEAGPKGYTGSYSCSVPLCDRCMGVKEYYGGESEHYNNMTALKEPELSDFHLKLACESPFDFNSTSEQKINGNSNCIMKSSFTNNVDGEFQKDSDIHLQVTNKTFQPDRNNDNEIGDGREMYGEPGESGISGDGQDCITPNEHPLSDIHEDEYEIFDLRIIHRKNRTGFEENKDLPIVLNTIIAGRYYVTEYLGSAAFGKVVQARDLHTGTDVCLKIIKNDKDFFDQSLDEIKLLKFVNKHDPADEHHILRLYDYFYHQEHLFIVCELLQTNLYEFRKFNQDSGKDFYFTLRSLQIITRQCLEGLECLHRLGIIHCDLKPENILIKSYSRCEIKIIDLGSSCFQTDNLCLHVQSRSYRAPEVILGLPYDQKIDIWSLGCVLAELCSGEVLFPNDALVMLLARMIGILGPIDMEMLIRGQETHKYFTKEYDLYHVNEETNQLEYIIPEESSLEHHLQVSDVGFIDFIKDLLEMNPERRPTARDALQHPWLSYPYK